MFHSVLYSDLGVFINSYAAGTQYFFFFFNVHCGDSLCALLVRDLCFAFALFALRFYFSYLLQSARLSLRMFGLACIRRCMPCPFAEGARFEKTPRISFKWTRRSIEQGGGGVEWGSIYTAIGIVSSPLYASDMMLKGNEPRKTSSLVHFHVAAASCATTCHFLIISQVFVLRYGRGRENNHVWTSSHCDTAICCGLPYQPSH